MKKKTIALLLALVMLVGIFAGCSKKGESDDPSKPATNDPSQPATPGQQTSSADALTAKYAYKAEYVAVEQELQYATLLCATGSHVYLTGEMLGDEITETDPSTGEEYTYNDYVTGIFMLDLDTGEMAELDQFAMPEIPEGWEGSSNINTMKAAEDGTLWALVETYSYRFNVPEDVDQTAPDFDRWSYYEEGNNQGTQLLHLNGDGSLISEVKIEQENETEDYYGGIYSFEVDAAGNLYASDWSKTYVFDANGTKLFTLEMGDEGGSLCKLDKDTVGLSVYTYDEATETSGRVFKPIDLQAKALSDETVALPQQAYTIFSGDDAYDFYYVYNGQNIFGYNFETGEAEKVVDWLEADVNSNNLQGYVLLPDGRVVACSMDWGRTGYPDVEIIVLTRVDASTLPQKTVITVACQYLDWDLRTKVINFNKNNDQYRVVIKDYSENADTDDTTGGLMKLNTEIMSGKVPDVFAVGSGMPISRYAGQGVVADLYQFIDNDEELSRDKLVQPVLKAAETDGKLYELPLTFGLQSAAGLNKVVGDYETWTLADLQDAMTKLQPDATVFNVYTTRSDMFYQCISRNLDAFVDWENKQVHFDSDEFVSLLEFCNSFPEEFNWDEYNYEEDGDEKTRMNNGKQLLTQVSFSAFDDYLYQCYGYDSGLKFVGYPSEDGTTGSSFYFGNSYAISAVSPNQDVAWAFVRSLLLDQKEASENGELWQFPMLKTAYDALLEQAMTPNYQRDENGDIMYDENGKPIMYPKMTYMDASASGYAGGSASIGSVSIGGGEAVGQDESVVVNEDGSISIYAMSQEDADVVLGLIENTTAVTRYDQSIMEVIQEQAAEFFAGAKTARETADLIQSRVGLYVMEQG